MNKRRPAKAERTALGFSGPELDAMAFAQNYYRWILDFFGPFLRGTVLELGAGIGNFSSHLVAAGADRLILVEPADELFEKLRNRFNDVPAIELFHGELSAWVTHQPRNTPVDVVVSVNVLEHIEDDLEALRLSAHVVRPGGSVLLLVPALPFIYGSLDVAFGHWRRYSKDGLVRLMTQAGLSVRMVRYVNMLGSLAWFVTGRVLRRRSLSPRMVRIGDALIVRAGKVLEASLKPPFGQSLIAIAEKPP